MGAWRWGWESWGGGGGCQLPVPHLIRGGGQASQPSRLFPARLSAVQGKSIRAAKSSPNVPGLWGRGGGWLLPRLRLGDEEEPLDSRGRQSEHNGSGAECLRSQVAEGSQVSPGQVESCLTRFCPAALPASPPPAGVSPRLRPVRRLSRCRGQAGLGREPQGTLPAHIRRGRPAALRCAQFARLFASRRATLGAFCSAFAIHHIRLDKTEPPAKCIVLSEAAYSQVSA